MIVEFCTIFLFGQGKCVTTEVIYARVNGRFLRKPLKNYCQIERDAVVCVLFVCIWCSLDKVSCCSMCVDETSEVLFVFARIDSTTLLMHPNSQALYRNGSICCFVILMKCKLISSPDSFFITAHILPFAFFLSSFGFFRHSDHSIFHFSHSTVAQIKSNNEISRFFHRDGVSVLKNNLK